MRALTAAAVFTLAVVSIPAVHVHAVPYTGNDSPGFAPMCFVITPGGAVLGLTTGQVYVDKDGQKWFCGTDGWMHQLVGTIALPSIPIVAPQSAGTASTP
jgi:hypothetical protein